MLGSDRYSWQKFKKAVRNPEMFADELRRLPLAANGRFYDAMVNPPPTDVFAEDWDNLVLLDGCRYDVFAEENTITGDLQHRISSGSDSGEFIEANFRGRDLHDTVYVTANPWVHEIESGTFYRVVDLINRDSCWDADVGTVRPETVVSETEKILDDFEDKRVIVHFMQPHYPFLGETGRSLDFGRGIYGDRHTEYEIGTDVWTALRDRGAPARERVRRAYRENLRLVLPHVRELISLLGGKTVVSADHGNMLGERLIPIPVRGYGHPPGVHVPQLVRIPWHVVERGERRTVEPDRPVEWEDPDSETVENRLRELGYR